MWNISKPTEKQRQSALPTLQAVQGYRMPLYEKIFMRRLWQISNQIRSYWGPVPDIGTATLFIHVWMLKAMLQSSINHRQWQFSPEDSTLGDFGGLSSAGMSSANPEAVAWERGERFGLAWDGLSCKKQEYSMLRCQCSKWLSNTAWDKHVVPARKKRGYLSNIEKDRK